MAIWDISMTAEQVTQFREWTRYEGAWRQERANTYDGTGDGASRWRREKWREAEGFEDIVGLIARHVEQERLARRLPPGAGEAVPLSHDQVVALHSELATWAARSGPESAGEFTCRLALGELSRILGRSPGELAAVAPPKPPGPPPVLLSVSIGDTVICRAGETITREEQRRRTIEAIARLEAANADDR